MELIGRNVQMTNRKWISMVDMETEGMSARKRVLPTDGPGGDGVDAAIVEYNLQGFWHSDLAPQEQAIGQFDLPEGGHTAEPGAPMLISEGLFVAIPRNAHYKGLNILSVSENELDGEYDVIPVPKPAREHEELKFIPNENIYGSDDIYPQTIVEYLDTIEVGGERCVHVMVYPMRYRPKSRKLSVVHKLMLEVQYTVFDETDSNSGPECGNGNDHIFSNQILRYGSCERDSGSLPRMLIITIPDFTSALDKYVQVKRAGLKTDIALCDDIYAKYPSLGHVDAIQKYILDEHAKSALKYVLLAGDLNAIPAKLQGSSGDTFVSDSYYSAKAGDFIPLFGLSRMPASTKKELQEMCAHALNYMTLSSKQSKNTVLTTYNRSDYEKCKEDIYNSSHNKFPMVRCYDGKVSKQALINEINKGQTFINYRGHGSYNCWQSSIGLTTSDVDSSLKEASCSPHVLSICCSNNDLRKTDCFGAEWIKKHRAITFLSASAPSYTVVNHDFDKYLWEALDKQGFTNISDIYRWATTTLYKNAKGADLNLVKENIQEYLLLGDPAADYAEEKKKVGYVLMLDASGSMYQAQNLVRLDAKTFVEYSLQGDQFGVNLFNNNAQWIYPGSANPATVSSSLKETSDAAAVIEAKYRVEYGPCTNIGDAIKLGNDMYPKLTTDIKAFVLLSDGAKNMGTDPDKVLGNEPPIYIAGIGPYFNEKYYSKMLAKNPKSKLYYEPDAYGMMLMFNDIRSDTASSGLLLNDGQEYKMGSNAIIKHFDLSNYNNEYQLGVVWTDKKYTYTDGYPGDNKISVVLYDPDNQKLKIKPTIIGNGYCIYNISGAKPGKWTVVIQYATNERMGGTIGGFEMNPAVQLEAVTPHYTGQDSLFGFGLRVRDKDGNTVDNAKVMCKITKSCADVGDLLAKYADQLICLEIPKELEKDAENTDILKLTLLREQRLAASGEDILGAQHTIVPMHIDKDGVYRCVPDWDCAAQDSIGIAGESGIYTMHYKVEGINPMTNFPYTYYKSHSVLIRK